MLDEAPPHHLFVYGTLRPDVDHPMAEHLGRHAGPVGEARIRGRLYDAGPYPALTLGCATADASEWVHGHLFRLDPGGQEDLLVALDRYEGCPLPGSSPPLFVRRTTAVTLADGSACEAWVYVYAREVGRFEPVPGGDWAAHTRDRDGA